MNRILAALSAALILTATAPAAAVHPADWNYNNGRMAQGFLTDCWPPDQLIIIWKSYGQVTSLATGDEGSRHKHVNSFNPEWHVHQTHLTGAAVWWRVQKTFGAERYNVDFHIYHGHGYCAQSPGCKLTGPTIPQPIPLGDCPK